MTATPKPKKESPTTPYVSSRAWAEERIKTIKNLQDEYLDMYVENKHESVEMLKVLAKIQILLEKKLK
jgi:hypothetical protein